MSIMSSSFGRAIRRYRSIVRDTRWYWSQASCSTTLISSSHLALKPRVLPVFGADLGGVLTLRTVDDADKLRRHLAAPKRLVIIGAGFIGMEIAASAASSGHQVTVVETMQRVLARVLAPEISTHVSEVHASHGISILTGRSVVVLHGICGRVTAVELDDGTRLSADTVIVGIGVVPRTALAKNAGPEIDDGIAVDEELLTSDPLISAIGDCSSFPSVHAKRRVRLESVQNAVDHGRHVAARRTRGARSGYAVLPWFWTHQYDMVIQPAGIGGVADDRVVAGDPASGRFSIFPIQGWHPWSAWSPSTAQPITCWPASD